MPCPLPHWPPSGEPADFDTVTSLAFAFVAFIIGGVLTSVAQRRYYQAVAKSPDEVLRDNAVLDEFLRRPSQIPAATISESGRRLRALRTARTDETLETLRRQTIGAIVFTAGAFIWIAASAVLRI